VLPEFGLAVEREGLCQLAKRNQRVAEKRETLQHRAKEADQSGQPSLKGLVVLCGEDEIKWFALKGWVFWIGVPDGVGG
jgi:hypothetical protein